MLTRRKHIPVVILLIAVASSLFAVFTPATTANAVTAAECAALDGLDSVTVAKKSSLSGIALACRDEGYCTFKNGSTGIPGTYTCTTAGTTPAPAAPPTIPEGCTDYIGKSPDATYNSKGCDKVCEITITGTAPAGGGSLGSVSGIVTKKTVVSCNGAGGTVPATTTPGTTTPGAATEDEDATPASTCKIAGVGWIVCPATTFLASIADGIMGILNGFLEVPAAGIFKQDGDAYKYWSRIRDYANIMFVIAFLFIIFSQVTSVGISNYGIKKLLPKLLLVALLVNTSFMITGIAVDVSNFLGYAAASLMGGESNVITSDLTKPVENVSGFDQGSTFGALAGLLLTLAIGGVMVYFFLAAFLGLILSAVVVGILVVTVLIIRQAAVILLVVLSPLAFACLLLPNTEGIYKKWWGMFKAMLLLFPIISLLYGAAKLAQSILQGISGTDPSAPTYNFLLNFMAEILPILVLVMVYSLLKKALSVIDGLDGVANGISNRGSKASQALLGGIRKRDQENRQILGNRIGKSNLPFVGQGRLKRAANRQSHLDAQKAEIDQIKNSHLLNDPKAQGYAQRQLAAQKLGNAAQTQAGTNALTALRNSSGGQAAILAEEAAKKKAEIEQAEVDTMVIKSASISGLDSAARDAQTTKNLADKQRASNYYSALDTDKARQTAIGAASGNTSGAARVALSVQSAIDQEFQEEVKMAAIGIRAGSVDNAVKMASLGEAADGSKLTQAEHAAAMEYAMEKGGFTQRREIIAAQAGSGDERIKQRLVEGIYSRGDQNIYGVGIGDQIKQNKITNDDSLKQAVLDNINGGNITAEQLVQNASATKLIAEMAAYTPLTVRDNLREQVTKAKESQQTKTKISDDMLPHLDSI